MGSMACFSRSLVLEVMGTLDVFRGVPGGAEHFEVPDAFEHVPVGVASRDLPNSLKMSCFVSSRAWNSCARSFSLSGFSKCGEGVNEKNRPSH